VDNKTTQTPKIQWVQGEGGIISIDVNKPESLNVLLTSAKINETITTKLLESIKHSTQLTNIASGTRIQIEVDETLDNREIKPKKLTIFLDSHKIETAFNSALNTYETKRITLPLEWQVKLVSGTINGSLFSSARKAGAEPTIISQLINLFSYDIDFQREIHTGDTFRIMYEYQTDYRGKIVKNPKILYANINLGNTCKELYRHVITSNSVEYYDRKGNSIKRSLLKTPINGAKITSSFGPRLHPILGYNRMHQGLDYGAPKGTPILAAGDGVVKCVKNLSRGYGKHIQIKHTNSYETLYAHLSRFASNVAPGSKVKQGQVIGYVGATGLASGPHLHYEVIKDGKKVNPSTMQAPKFFPLKGTELTKFKDNIRKLEQMVAELDDKKVNAVALNLPKKK
jgi:murein DD-endopeptidase MepM/ murein hydrolase activator NlpD